MKIDPKTTELIRQHPPDVIYLQWDGEQGEYPWGATWTPSKKNEDDIVYVRVQLKPNQIMELAWPPDLFPSLKMEGEEDG